MWFGESYLLNHEGNAPGILFAENRRPASIICFAQQSIKPTAGQHLEALIQGKCRRPTHVRVSRRPESATASYCRR